VAYLTTQLEKINGQYGAVMMSSTQSTPEHGSDNDDNTVYYNHWFKFASKLI
jgi:hypothetical protein